MTTAVAQFSRAVGLLIAAALLVVAPAARADHPTRYSAQTSPGGTAYYHRFDDITPYASVTFGWQTEEQKNREGLRALLPGLLFSGVFPKMPYEYYERLADVHGSTSLSVGETQTIADVKAPAKQVGAALELLLKALREGEPNVQTVRRMRTNATAAEMQGAVRGDTQVGRTAAIMLLGDHPITRAFDPKRFDAVRQADIATWRTSALDDSPLRIVVSGRISAVDAGRLLDKAFASWPKPQTASRAPKPAVSAQPTSISLPVTGKQAIVQLQAPTKDMTGREGRIAGLAHGVFGAGSSSRLWTVRSDLGATYGASSSLAAISRDQRRVIINAAVDPAQTDASVAALKKAYATWYNDGITDAELKAQRDRMVTGFGSVFRDPSNANRQLLGLLLDDRPAGDLEDYESHLLSLTRDDVNAFIKARFPKPDDFLLVVGVPDGTTFSAACAVKSPAEVRSACAPR
jgi:predicted Zn-dependent peptidase